MAELVTTGIGEVRRTADRARLSLRYTSRARDRTGAVDVLTRQVVPVVALLAGQGVTQESSRLFVHDVWDGKRRGGAEATQHYTALVTDLAILDDLIGQLVLTEPADLRGPAWELADRSAAYREAQAAAVAAARDTADGYAAALGARLGRLTRLDDTSPPGQAVPMAFAAKSSARRTSGPPDIAELALEPESVTVSAMCSITWEISVPESP
jgi:hypothetical protein